MPIMDLSGGVRDGAGASPTSPRPSLSAAAKTIPDGSRDAGTVEALSQRAATRRLINEALRQLRNDPMLMRYDVIVVDEVGRHPEVNI